MLIIFSAFAAIVPMSIYLVLIWKFDRYDREPFKLVFTNYLWGALGAIVLALLGSLIFTAAASLFIKDTLQLSRFGAVVVAPIVEEITKGLFLLITISNRKFDNITDGIVYGGAIGLGFGMTENFLYFVTYSESIANWITLVIVRSLFSAVMHCVSTATLGAFLGLAKFKSASIKVFYAITGLLIAMMIHSIWNFSLSYEDNAPLGFLFILVSIIIFISVFSVSLRSERKIIFSELQEESANGIIPESHLAILSSPQRERKGWLDERNRKAYIKAATTLAFRKVQLKNSNGASKVYYQMDVDNYRDFIIKLLQST
ncbi:MAG: PrsW family intramembrane metalloprotease [Ignavibacteriaceae bacterium]|nr:PrsW family intramembrane metalloprotease [Ignavibacterium sp.]MCC6254861.1 PrsW family intramembrane metalloprotease [Ignavibacteriaceae bacterium]HRQ53663.1 PrsW family intramembrane metalloprotease [Ignavibacteriaceae bacterium]